MGFIGHKLTRQNNAGTRFFCSNIIENLIKKIIIIIIEKELNKLIKKFAHKFQFNWKAITHIRRFNITKIIVNSSTKIIIRKYAKYYFVGKIQILNKHIEIKHKIATNIQNNTYTYAH